MDDYFMYWSKKEHEYVEVNNKEISNQYYVPNDAGPIIRAAIKCILNRKSIFHGRITDSIVSGLESIGGFFESLMHIGLLIVFFF